jgi:hypothetical protein
MKIFEYKEYRKWLEPVDMANLFHVYFDGKELENNSLTYNINRTLRFQNIDKTPPNYFEDYIVRRNDTWLLISYNTYGTTKLWWLLCKINNVTSPIDDPEVGSTVKLLNSQFIPDVLKELRS